MSRVSLRSEVACLGLPSGHPPMASGRDTTAEWGTRAAALSADGGQLAAAQQAQRLTEIEGQAIPLTTWDGKGRGERRCSGQNQWAWPPETYFPTPPFN